MRKFLRSIFYLLLPKSYLNIYKYFLKNNTLLYYPYFGKHTKNVGDAINPILFEQLTNKKSINSNSVLNIFNRDKFFFIGSVLDQIDNNSIVLGAGFISKDSPVKIPKKIYAVRGPMTREKFISNNISCPEIYCDPGLLISKSFPIKIPKKYKYGIVPHYIDKDNPIIDILLNNPVFKILNIENKYDIFLKELNQCEYVFSSSLHGIIFSISYLIPCGWIKFSDNVYGNDFKFFDFFESIHLNIEPSPANMLLEDINTLKQNSILVDTSIQQLKLISILKEISK